MLYYIYTEERDLTTPKKMSHIRYWQQQVNLFENRIREYEDDGRTVPEGLFDKLALAKASLKIWRAA